MNKEIKEFLETNKLVGILTPAEKARQILYFNRLETVEETNKKKDKVLANAFAYVDAMLNLNISGYYDIHGKEISCMDFWQEVKNELKKIESK